MIFYFITNVLIFFRLFFFFRDKSLSKGKVIVLSLLQIIPLLILNIELKLIIFLIIITGINFFTFYLEKRSNTNLARFISFLLILVITSIFSSDAISLTINKPLLNFFSDLKNYFFLFNFSEEFNGFKINIILFGFLLILNEINLFIRYVFEAFNLYPKIEAGGNKLDKEEYNAGRVIGMLERILIFFFVLIDQFAAIGFIIAAKGFTRFKELDRREFAEYVLIGTLLSSLLAFTMAFIVKGLIN